jgi:ubiquinone/menaquinone biosynthesis C-methylase UbiE
VKETDGQSATKWDRASVRFDLFSAGAEKRWGPWKQAFFSAMGSGRILLAAVGTGLDIPFFPPGCEIVGIDISEGMLEKARPRAQAYRGKLELRKMSLHALDFPDHSFDQVFTSCTFCSVPDPVKGLQEVRRVLVPGGELRMFEHTGSKWFPFNLMLDLMTPLTRLGGPEVNRDTVANVRRAGFEVRRVYNFYLDVVKTIEAVAP